MEGREGLLLGLERAAKEDATLRLQLEVMLRPASEGTGVIAGACSQPSAGSAQPAALALPLVALPKPCGLLHASSVRWGL